MRRIALSLFAFSALFLPLQAQQPLSCSGEPSLSGSLRAEGHAELIGNAFQIWCDNGQAGERVSTDVAVFFNTKVTSRIVQPGTNLTEALVFVDRDPAETPILGVNVFQGEKTAPNALLFRGVSFEAPGPNNRRYLELANIRVDANALGVSNTLIPSQVVALISMSGLSVNSPQRIAGYVVPGGIPRLENAAEKPGNVAISGCRSNPAAPDFFIRYSEGQNWNAFRRRNPATSLQAPNAGSPDSDWGIGESTESGFTHAQLPQFLGTAGSATQGTRFTARFTGVPEGTAVYVTTRQVDAGTLQAILTESDSVGGGAFKAAAPKGSVNFAGQSIPIAQVSLQGGAGIATWEVLESSPIANETPRFGVIMVPGSMSGAMQVRPAFGPITTGDTIAPRFADTALPVNVSITSTCEPPPPPVIVIPEIWVSRESIQLTRDAGTAASILETVTVEGNGSRQVSARVEDTPWLAIENPLLLTPGALRIRVNPSQLPPGEHRGTILLTSSGAEVRTIKVVLRIEGRPQLVTLVEGLSFAYQPGGLVPDAQKLYITAHGRQTRYTASADPAWLAVTPNSGQSPANLDVRVNPVMLSPGSHSGTITITGDGATNGPLIIPVTVVVAEAPRAFTESSIRNAASQKAGPVAPGLVIEIAGSGLGPQQAAFFSPSSSGLPTEMGGTRVLFDGAPAPILSAQSTKVIAVVPSAIAGRREVRIEVEVGGRRIGSATVPVATAAPAVYTLDGRAAAALNADGSPNSDSHPAAAGDSISLYLTGSGLLDAPLADGHVGSVEGKPALALRVRIGGQPAEVTYTGTAFFAGVLQVNAKVPRGINGRSIVDVEVGDARSQAGVTIAVE